MDDEVKGSPKERRIASMNSVQQKPISPKRSLLDFIWPLQHSICRICCKVFNSPKALCGHMRIHGSHEFPTEPIKLRMKKLYREMERRRSEKIGHAHDEQRISDFCGSVSVSVSGDPGHRKPLSEIGNRKIESFESQMNCSGLVYPLSMDDQPQMLMIHNSRSKKMKVEVEYEAMKHECSICKKRFSSHQALGGHKSSSHSKFKVQDQGLAAAPESPPPYSSSSSPHVHQCKICQKIFQTGQALGGHMRAHWTGGVTSHTEGSILGLAIPNGFPLIELPPQSKEADQKAPH